TATSAAHVQKLLRQTDEVVFCFDGDAAGRKAAWQALEVSLAHLADGKTVRFLFLPAEHDPDSFVRERGAEAFGREIGESRPLSEFLVDELKGGVDLGTAEGRSRLLHEAKPLLQKVSAPALQLQLLKAVAEATAMTQEETTRLAEVRLPRDAGVRPGRTQRLERGAQAPELKMVRILLQCLLSKPPLARELSTGLLDQSSPEANALIAVAEFCRENPDTEGNMIVERFRATEFRHLIEANQAALLDTKLETEDMEVDFREALRLLREKQGRQRFEVLRVKKDRAPEEEAEMLGFLRERKPAPASASTDARIAGFRPIP
ncbi:MAG: toprim domain-containing protein, partial [Burkholderiales bacterium]